MTLIEHPSPNHSPRLAGVRVDTILLHHTADASASNSITWMCQPKSGVSAHYLVGKDGRIWRIVSEELKAWHAGKGRMPWETCEPYDLNHRSIGIELVNPGDGVTPFTEAQYRALGEILPDLVRRLGWQHTSVRSIAPETNTSAKWGIILGHRDVAPGRKTDPADNFDWGRVRAMLAGRVA